MTQWQESTHAAGNGAAPAATCETCHGAYQEGHPGAGVMALPMASETCRTCHKTTFAEWEDSDHGAGNIECFDCHLSHSQGLRTGGEETLCSACHEPRRMAETHVTHDIVGLQCSGCHMSPATPTPEGALEVTATAHSFGVDSQACLECHSKNARVGNANAAVRAEDDPAGKANMLAVEPEGDTLAQMRALERRLASLRNIAAAGMGVAFGIGGFVGLIAGIAGMALVQRRRHAGDGR
jgi:hypothetical protein